MSLVGSHHNLQIKQRRPDEKEAKHGLALTKSTAKNRLPEVKRSKRLHKRRQIIQEHDGSFRNRFTCGDSRKRQRAGLAISGERKYDYCWNISGSAPIFHQRSIAGVKIIAMPPNQK